ncbi:hypothetical protein AVEN_244528-1 [Araneus ventricosus]|uniref:Uncharacterized protein n=1 Tax=Araneus ventricosus TaxID=182803 RepID=A0A4Y2F6F8_ARAVE|nr:hypothetical protein AVEN_244528-1 [Araneus ventricosus]
MATVAGHLAIILREEQQEEAGLYHLFKISQKDPALLCHNLLLRPSDRWHVSRKGRKSAIRGAINMENTRTFCVRLPQAPARTQWRFQEG